MPHICLPPKKPGMVGLAAYRPDVYTYMGGLANLMLHQEHPSSTLTLADRELIATYVSYLNRCQYCHSSHGAIAAAHSGNPELVQQVSCDYETSKSTPKMKALLKIGGMVQKSGKEVSKEAVDDAIKNGASEMDIHDAILIASMFCMFNRYVDGLGTEMPEDRETFEQRGEMIAERGYQAPPPTEVDENKEDPEDQPPAYAPEDTQPSGKAPISCGHSQYSSVSRELEELNLNGSTNGEKGSNEESFDDYTGRGKKPNKYFCAHHHPCDLDLISANKRVLEQEMQSQEKKGKHWSTR